MIIVSCKRIALIRQSCLGACILPVSMYLACEHVSVPVSCLWACISPSILYHLLHYTSISPVCVCVSVPVQDANPECFHYGIVRHSPVVPYYQCERIISNSEMCIFVRCLQWTFEACKGDILSSFVQDLSFGEELASIKVCTEGNVLAVCLCCHVVVLLISTHSVWIIFEQLFW